MTKWPLLHSIAAKWRPMDGNILPCRILPFRKTEVVEIYIKCWKWYREETVLGIETLCIGSRMASFGVENSPRVANLVLFNDRAGL